MKDKKLLKQTIIEEIANSITHGIGFGLSVAGLILLVLYASYTGDPWRIVAFSIYGTTLALLYLFSTLYHSISHSRIKSIFRRIDHSSIYLLIAGTYTPIILITLRDSWVLYMLPIIWVIALLGIIKEIKYFNYSNKLSLLLYIGMGWMSLIAIKPLYENIPIESFALIIVGGLAYTFGIVFYIWEKLPFHHTIWHGFVMAGSILHFIGMLYI